MNSCNRHLMEVGLLYEGIMLYITISASTFPMYMYIYMYIGGAETVLRVCWQSVVNGQSTRSSHTASSEGSTSRGWGWPGTKPSRD